MIFILQLCPHNLCFLFVLSHLQPKSFLDDCSDEIAVVSWTYVYLKGFFVLLNVELAIDAVSEVYQKEKLFVLVYLYAHTIFPRIAKPNGGHVVPKRVFLCLEDRMRWLSQVFGSFDARVTKLQLLLRESMVFGVMLDEMVNALGLDFHDAVVKVLLAASSVPAVLDFQRTFVLDGFNFFRLQFQSMWFESGEAVAQLDASTYFDAEVVHQVCLVYELLE